MWDVSLLGTRRLCECAEPEGKFHVYLLETLLFQSNRPEELVLSVLNKTVVRSNGHKQAFISLTDTFPASNRVNDSL